MTTDEKRAAPQDEQQPGTQQPEPTPEVADQLEPAPAEAAQPEQPKKETPA